jgi:hypothetical protein
MDADAARCEEISFCHQGGKQLLVTKQGCFMRHITNNREENLLEYTLWTYKTHHRPSRARALDVERNESNPLSHENLLLIFYDIHGRPPRSIERRESISFVRLHRPSIVLVYV